MLAHEPANFPTAAPRHQHIEQHQRGARGVEKRERLVAIVRDDDGEATRFEERANDLRVVIVVVDDQDRLRGRRGDDRS
jgi:hypothetical protein